ncbi:MAG: DUF3800 domain-containing protein [Gemella sp.]|nr:DUF3800 domain-containing protein [Gemella sp.]
MDLYIYSDESGVFDYKHNEYFVFGGVIYLSKESKDESIREYTGVEKELRKRSSVKNGVLKATRLKNKHKRRLFNSLKGTYKFAVIIKESRVNAEIFNSKKSKQRYLDYAFKIGLKRTLGTLIERKIIDKTTINTVYVYQDEHSTATNGLYELREALYQELKYGTHNFKYNMYHPPLFEGMENVLVEYLNSEKHTLIRAADIVANKIYRSCMDNKREISTDELFITRLP